MHVECILVDNHHFEMVKPVLDYFFEHVLLPCLLMGPSTDTSAKGSSQGNLKKKRKRHIAHVAAVMKEEW